MTNVTITKDGEVIREVKYNPVGAGLGIAAGVLYAVAMKRATSNLLGGVGSSLISGITGAAFGAGVYSMFHVYEEVREAENGST